MSAERYSIRKVVPDAYRAMINGWNRIAISTRMEPAQYQSRLTPSPEAESVS